MLYVVNEFSANIFKANELRILFFLAIALPYEKISFALQRT
jgi:hypothetical protein